MAAAKSLTPAEIQNALAFIAHGANPERNRCLFLMSALMATSNSPTHGHPKFPQAAPSDYDPSAWMAKRAAASLSL